MWTNFEMQFKLLFIWYKAIVKTCIEKKLSQVQYVISEHSAILEIVVRYLS